jgi:hypothetical protein
MRREQEDRARRAEAQAEAERDREARAQRREASRLDREAARPRQDEPDSGASGVTIPDLKQAYDLRDEARDVLDDPVGYVQQKLLEEILKGANQKAAASPQDDTVDFVHDRAKELGNMGAGNPFARAVRDASMAELANVQKRTLRDLDDVADQIASFGRDPPPLPQANPFAASGRSPPAGSTDGLSTHDAAPPIAAEPGREDAGKAAPEPRGLGDPNPFATALRSGTPSTLASEGGRKGLTSSASEPSRCFDRADGTRVCAADEKGMTSCTRRDKILVCPMALYQQAKAAEGRLP